MTAARLTNTEFKAPEVVNTIYQRSIGVGLLFGLASLLGAVLQREQFFHSYLLGFMLWLGVTLGSMAFLMIQHLTGGKWGMVIRRQLEAAMKTLPLMAILFIPIIAGMPHLYGVWLNADPKNQHLVELSHVYLTRAGTANFLFLNGYIGRAVTYFAIWLAIAFILNRWSAEQDSPPVRNLSPRFRKIAAPGLILYAFTISFAVIDWVMSLAPPWISTIYGFIFIAGECLSAMCIWAGNLPSEISFFTRRIYSGWQIVPLALVIFHFAVPFLLLLSRQFKRDAKTLVWLASWLLFMRFVDLFWYIEPNFHKTIYISWLDLVVPVAIGGFWLAMFFHNLRSRPLLPVYDLHAQEFLEYVEAAHD